MPGAQQHCPMPRGVSAPTSHFHRCPLQPLVPTLSPHAADTWAPLRPTATAPSFHMAEVTVSLCPPSTRWLPLTLSALSSQVSTGKTQTLNILQMKQQQARCQQHGTGSQPLLRTTPVTGGKQAKSCLGIWVGDLLHLCKGQMALQLSDPQPSR